MDLLDYGEKSLSVAFGNSLKEDLIPFIGDFAEVGIDAIIENKIFGDIPIVSTVIAIFKIGSSIKERSNIKKLAVFLNEINNGIINEDKRTDYRREFEKNEKFRNKELEYLLVLMDRYIGYDKPKLLAKLYLAYLDKVIIWEELTMYAEVIDRFLLLDCSTLLSEAEITIVHKNKGGEAVLRLVALGLMMEVTDTSTFVKREDGGYALTWESLERATWVDKTYKKTEFGEKLAQILR